MIQSDISSSGSFHTLVWEADCIAMTTSVNRHIVSSETVTDCVCDGTCVVLISAFYLQGQSVSACPGAAGTSPSLCPLSDRQEDASVTLAEECREGWTPSRWTPSRQTPSR